MTLLLCRLYAGRRRRLLKTYLYYFSFFLITLTFLYDLLMLYDNEIFAFRHYKFDYLLTDFDQTGLEQLSRRPDVEGVYAARLIGTDIRTEKAHGTADGRNGDEIQQPREEPAEDFQVYLADSWDDEGLSFLSTDRPVAGKREALGEDSIVMDILSARALKAEPGDRILISIGGEECAFRLDMILEPEFVLNTGIAVCLYSQDIKTRWLKHFDEEPAYSVLFLKGDDPGLESYLYDDYSGPMAQGLGEKERRQINRASIIRKEWMIDDAKRNFLFTPPAVFAICLAALFLSIFFIRRESGLRLQEEQDSLQVLSRLGMPERRAVWIYILLTGLQMSQGCLLAAIITKKGIYDRFIQTHYLSWKLVWEVAALVCVLCFAITVAAAFWFWKAADGEEGRPGRRRRNAGKSE